MSFSDKTSQASPSLWYQSGRVEEETEINQLLLGWVLTILTRSYHKNGADTPR